MNNPGTIIIAEAGVNHNGSLDLAIELARIAFNSGSDFVKFQTFNSESLATENASLAKYQEAGTDKLDQLSMLKNLELSKTELKELYLYCNHIGIRFLSTPFDTDSLKLLDQFDMDFIKIASGEITNYPLLFEISKKNKPIILSTGMSTNKDIGSALNVLTENGISKNMITLMQCNTQYPTPYQDVNLYTMETMKVDFGTKVGFSDHTKGIEASLAAVAMGARIIEKHFTTDKDLLGPDHKASLNPDQLNSLVSSIRNIEKCFGRRLKAPTSSEKGNLKIVRKSIVAKTDIKLGEVLTIKNLTTKRPGTGLSPMKWRDIIGSNSTKSYKKDDLIK